MRDGCLCISLYEQSRTFVHLHSIIILNVMRVCRPDLIFKVSEDNVKAGLQQSWQFKVCAAFKTRSFEIAGMRRGGGTPQVLDSFPGASLGTDGEMGKWGTAAKTHTKSHIVAHTHVHMLVLTV